MTTRLLALLLVLHLAGAPALRADDGEATPEQIAALLAGGRLEGTTYTNAVLQLRLALPPERWVARPAEAGLLASFARRPGAGCLGLVVYPRRRDLPLRRAVGELDPAKFPGFTLSPFEKTERELAGKKAVHARQVMRAADPKLSAVIEHVEQLVVAQGDWIVALQWLGPAVDAGLWDEVERGVAFGVDAPAGDPATAPSLDAEVERVAAAGKVERRVWRNAALGVTLPLPDGFKPGVKTPRQPGERGKVLLAGESATSVIEVRVDLDHADPLTTATLALAECGGAARRLDLGGGRPAASLRGTLAGAQGERLLLLGTMVTIDGWRLTLTWAGPPEDRSGEAFLSGLVVGGER